MTYVKLRKHAPEAQDLTTCAVCGRDDQAQVTGHLLAGQPGTAGLDGGLCEACGTVLSNLELRVGPTLALDVEEAQQQASEREITTPRPA